MATIQLSLWDDLTPAKPLKTPLWNDVALPRGYYRFFKEEGCCPNCYQPLRHYIHALNHFKKFHMKHRFFVWYFGMWNEVSQAAWAKAREKHRATARTK